MRSGSGDSQNDDDNGSGGGAGSTAVAGDGADDCYLVIFMSLWFSCATHWL